MPRLQKIRVSSETDKKKAEIFNYIDDLILSTQWNEALDKLFYLLRNAPDLYVHVRRKLALLYYEMKNYQKSLSYLQELIPSSDFQVNRTLVECLCHLDEEKLALWYLARAPITDSDKRKLLSSIVSVEKVNSFEEKAELFLSEVTIRCPKCTRFLFFENEQFNCLLCDFSGSFR